MRYLQILFHDLPKAVVEPEHFIYDGTNHTERVRKPLDQRIRLRVVHVYEHTLGEDQRRKGGVEERGCAFARQEKAREHTFEMAQIRITNCIDL